MGPNKLGILAAAERKQAGIAENKKNLGIRPHLVLDLPLPEWAWQSDSDSKGEEESSNGKNGSLKDRKKSSTNLLPSMRNRISTKRWRQESENEPSSSKRYKPNCDHGENNEAGSSGTCAGGRSSNPPELTLHKADPTKPKQEQQHLQAAMYTNKEYDFLYDEEYNLPPDARIPDPDLSFLEN